MRPYFSLFVLFHELGENGYLDIAASNGPTVYKPGTVNEFGKMKISRGKSVLLREICPSATLITNLKSTTQALNPSLRSNKSETV
jgi:hypothetical protein